MKLQNVSPRAMLLLTIACLAPHILAARKPADSVLLSNVKTLTLREGKPTSARRVSSVPQLSCIGGNARGLYNVDVIRCTNSGSEYEDDDVQWTCKASLPPEFRLGSTDVICEGYDSPDDPYILKGSCGVEYRLVLTEAGEQKYGQRKGQGEKVHESTKWDTTFLVWLAIVAGIIIYAVWSGCGSTQQRQRRGGGGEGGGGARWGHDDNNDPPPPYTQQAPPRPKTSQTSGSQSWRPGFYTGAATGGAAGYGAGYMAGRNATRRDDPMVGSSRGAHRGGGNGQGGAGSSSSAPSSSRYESTGFGSTSRR